MNIQRHFAQIFLIIAVLLSSAKISLGESSSTIIYLMKEPVSLLDFGLYKLERDFESLLKLRNVQAIVLYDYHSNRIIFKFQKIPVKLFESRTEAKDWCLSIICEIREQLGIDCATINPKTEGKNSWVYLYFSHEGYIYKNVPNIDMGSEIDKLVKIEAIASWNKIEGDSKVLKTLHCEVPLLGKEVLCSD